MAESRESVITTQRKEKKELLGRIQEMKHGIPKGDKKKKKEITIQIAILEAELADKHEKELNELEELPSSQKDECYPGNIKINDQTTNDEPPQRITRAQKRRNKKADRAKGREEAIVQQEVDNLSGKRNIELEKINQLLSERELSIYEVPSDGDCLYKAVEHQLSSLNLQKTTVRQLRQQTADYMLSHKDDFIPFLTNSVSGDVMSEAQYKAYCQDIANKPAWGGQVEIQAISDMYGVSIEVIQAEGPTIIMGENELPSKLILSYHRHMYGLGEHYNSIIKKCNIEENL